jgi:hypothetical protein
MNAAMQWLTGKKTYIGAAAMAATSLVSFWYGKSDATTLFQMLSGALVVVGIGHKFDRQLQSVTDFLQQERSGQ